MTQCKYVDDRDISIIIIDTPSKSSFDLDECILSLNKCMPSAELVILTTQKISNSFKSVMPGKGVGSSSVIGAINSISRQYLLILNTNNKIIKKGDLFIFPGEKINSIDLVENPIFTSRLFHLNIGVQFSKTGLLKKLWVIEKMAPKFQTGDFSFQQNRWFSWAMSRHKVLPLISHQFDVNYVDFLFWKDILKNDFNFFSLDSAGVESKLDNRKMIKKLNLWLKAPSRYQFILLLLNKFFVKK